LLEFIQYHKRLCSCLLQLEMAESCSTVGLVFDEIINIMVQPMDCVDDSDSDAEHMAVMMMLSFNSQK
jgi:hypothetical protein